MADGRQGGTGYVQGSRHFQRDQTAIVIDQPCVLGGRNAKRHLERIGVDQLAQLLVFGDQATLDRGNARQHPGKFRMKLGLPQPAFRLLQRQPLTLQGRLGPVGPRLGLSQRLPTRQHALHRIGYGQFGIFAVRRRSQAAIGQSLLPLQRPRPERRLRFGGGQIIRREAKRALGVPLFSLRFAHSGCLQVERGLGIGRIDPNQQRPGSHFGSVGEFRRQGDNLPGGCRAQLKAPLAAHLAKHGHFGGNGCRFQRQNMRQKHPFSG